MFEFLRRLAGGIGRAVGRAFGREERPAPPPPAAPPEEPAEALPPGWQPPPPEEAEVEAPEIPEEEVAELEGWPRERRVEGNLDWTPADFRRTFRSLDDARAYIGESSPQTGAVVAADYYAIVERQESPETAPEYDLYIHGSW